MELGNERKKLPPEAVELYTRFIHGEIGRRDFLDGAKRFAAAGLTATAIVDALMPNYALGQQISKTDERIKTSYETILREGDSSEHLDNIANASTSDGLQFNGFSDADLNAIRQKLADLSQAGTPIATIIGKVQAL